MHNSLCRTLAAAALVLSVAAPLAADTRIRIMPPDRATFALGQRFDIRVEATSDTAAPPRGLRVFIDGVDVTAKNILDAGTGGERGAGGAGCSDRSLPVWQRAGQAPPTTTNFLLRGHSWSAPGAHTLRATTSDGGEARVAVTATAWNAARAGAARARNVILFLGDGMGAAHRTAARIISRGVSNGKADAPLAMDTLEVSGQVMTASLNAVITDSAPGMASYVTGSKQSNNQEGVYPDNTEDMFDNPRVEYLGELLRRVRGRGFNVGIITTADVTDATPGANAVHTADRNAGPEIAARFFDERPANAVSVLMGGGSRHFAPHGTQGSSRPDERDLAGDFTRAGYTHVTTRTDLQKLSGSAPAAILGLFHPRHLAVAFDKIGAGRYSDELAQPRNANLRDQPMLDEMTRVAIESLSKHSLAGFYLMVEGASIDKQAHAVDAERTIWDVVELDNAVAAALEFADRTNGDADPTNDTLVIVTADHECGGLGIIAVGNERYAPSTLGEPVRDYAAVFRFAPDQLLNFFPNYARDAQGYPTYPDPSRKLLFGWAAAPDHFENWMSNRQALDAAVTQSTTASGNARPTTVSVANPARDGAAPTSDNTTVEGKPIPGFLVQGTIENGASGCPAPDGCPADTASSAHIIAGHTATDVPLSATGPGAIQFTGTYDNTDVFLKILKAAAGSYASAVPRRAQRAPASSAQRTDRK